MSNATRPGSLLLENLKDLCGSVRFPDTFSSGKGK
jgi:hypothetical protein